MFGPVTGGGGDSEADCCWAAILVLIWGLGIGLWWIWLILLVLAFCGRKYLRALQNSNGATEFPHPNVLKALIIDTK